MISHFYQRKGKFKTCEDSLTSITFDGLKYLPTEIFYQILRNSVLHDKLPVVSGELMSITFWEHWDPTNTSNTRRVEPDVFLRFEYFDIIFEAKRNNEKQQNKIQHQDQIRAYHNEYSDCNKKLYYIQLGGLHNLEDEQDFPYLDKSVTIGKTNWTKLLNEICSTKENLAKIQDSNHKAYTRILDDLILGFEMHQFYKIKWLKALPNIKILSDNFNFKVNFQGPFLNKPLVNLEATYILSENTNNLFQYAR